MAQRLYLLTIFALSAALLYMQFAPSGGEVGDDLYIVVGGNPPSVAVFDGSKFLGGPTSTTQIPTSPSTTAFYTGTSSGVPRRDGLHNQHLQHLRL